MGNVLTQDGAKSKGDPCSDDLKWLQVESSAIFHDSYVVEQYENLPAFEGTELPEEKVKRENESIREDVKTKRLLELLSGAGRIQQPSVAETFNVEEGIDDASRGFTGTIRMRSRLLQRVHLAILRESDRVRGSLKANRKHPTTSEAASNGNSHRSLIVHTGESSQMDSTSLLNMASMRISLSLLKTLKGTNPQIFTNMCESLMGLFELCPPEAWRKVNANRAQRETLQQITDFAASVARTGKGEERAFALALMFSLGVSRGSVSDLLQTVKFLNEGEEPLPDTAMLAPFWKRLMDHRPVFQLPMPNMFTPDGDDTLIKSPSSSANHGNREVSIESSRAAITTDGTYLYTWNAQLKSLDKVGTGLNGTIAGTVYERNPKLLKAIRIALGLPPSISSGREGEMGDEYQTRSSASPSISSSITASMDVLLARQRGESTVSRTNSLGILSMSALLPPTIEDEEKDDEAEHKSDPLPNRIMVRIRRVAIVHSGPDLDTDEIAMLNVGEEHEVLQQAENLGLHWVRVQAGWMCVEGVERIDSGSEGENGDETDFEESRTLGFPDISVSAESVDRLGSQMGGMGGGGGEGGGVRIRQRWAGSMHSSASLAMAESPVFEFFRAGPGVGRDGNGPVTSTAGGESNNSRKYTGEAREAWLAYVGGKLYFKAKAGMNALDYAIISASSLKLESIETFQLPVLESSSLRSSSVEENRTSVTDATAAAATSNDGLMVHSVTSGPADNYATYELGACVVGNPEAPVAGDGQRERNLLLPIEERVPSEDGSTSYILEGGSEGSTYPLQIDLGEVRQISRIGIEFSGPEIGSLATALLTFVVGISTDGSTFTSWPSDCTGPSPPSSPFFLTMPTPVAVRHLRFGIVSNAGSIQIYRIYACGSIEGTQSKSEPIIPAFVSDGRHIYVLHISKPPPMTPSNIDESASPPIIDDPGDDHGLIRLHTFDPRSKCIIRSTTLALYLDQAALHRRALVTNGHQFLLLQLIGGDTKRPSYQGTVINLDPPEVMEEKDLRWDSGSSASPSALSQALTYDIWNNFIWGLDPASGKFNFWRNAGLPPRLYPPKPTDPHMLPLSSIPAYRIEGLSSELWQGREEEIGGATGLQAAQILACLDRCGETYGVSERSQAGGESGVINEVVVSSVGNADGTMLRFSVRGHHVGCSTGKGFCLVRLDELYQAVDSRSFDTSDPTNHVFNDLMLDYVSHLPTGTVVLVACKEDAAKGLSLTGKRALRLLGADGSIEKLEASDLYVLIGRKGATSSVVQKLAKKDHGPAIARQKIPLINVPLSVEPSQQTISALIRIILSNKDALVGQSPSSSTPLKAINLLSALNLLITNIHQLVAGSSSSSYIKDVFKPQELSDLQSLLLQTLDEPPKGPAGESLSEAALKLFITALDVFYPTATERCSLLIDFMKQYIRNELSSLEAAVLGLLLKRISSPSSLLSLMDEQKKVGAGAASDCSSSSSSSSAVGVRTPTSFSPCLDLFKSILNIAQGEVVSAIENAVGLDKLTDQEDKYSIGRAAVHMLASLSNQLLSQTVQSIVVTSQSTNKTSEQKGFALAADINVLLSIFTSLSESSISLLDKAIQEATTADAIHYHSSSWGSKDMLNESSRRCSISSNSDTSIARRRSVHSAHLSLSQHGNSGNAFPLSTISPASPPRPHHHHRSHQEQQGYRQPYLSRELDAALKSSPVGALLPLVIFVIIDLVRYQSSTLIPALSDLAKAVAPLMDRVRKIVELLPKDQKRPACDAGKLAGSGGTSSAAAAGGIASNGPRKRKSMVMESEHPYRPNMNEYITLSMPRAERITIVFDEQCKTETNYDYVIFWRNDQRTEKWHPDIERFTGRSGNENWPGSGGRPPLVIEGNGAVIEWHSDGSNEDWGWKFTATGEYKKTAVIEDVHWLVQLDRHVSACGAALSKGLTVSVEWAGEVEDRNVIWMEEEALSSSTGSNRASTPSNTTTTTTAPASSSMALTTSSDTLSPPRKSTTNEEGELQFLHSLVTRPADSPAANLVLQMRKLVREDRGRYDVIDTAVYASIAALIKHNGLTSDAIAVATEARSDVPVPEALVRVWKSGAKMRQYFQYGDVQAARQREVGGSNSVPSVLERGPSVYSGAEDTVIENASREVVERAQFLLRLEAPRAAKILARRRWAMFSQGKGSESPPPATEEQQKERWAAVVKELHADHKIKSIFEYRRRAAEKKSSQRTVTEQLLRFLQASAKVEEVEAIKELRSRRASYRADGIQLLTTLLTQSTSVPAKVYLLNSFMKALREARHSKDATFPHIHYQNGVEGCSLECAARLAEAFLQFLKACVELLRSIWPFLEEGEGTEHTGAGGGGDGGGGGGGSGGSHRKRGRAEEGHTRRQLRQQLATAVLQACSLDYDVKDHALIEESDIVAVLEKYLSSSIPAIRATAWKLFETLLPKAHSPEEQQNHHHYRHLSNTTSSINVSITEAPTNLSRQLLSLVIKQLEIAAHAARPLSTLMAPSDTSSTSGLAGIVEASGVRKDHIIIQDQVIQLTRDAVGQVAPHTPLGLTTSFSFWFYRPKGQLDDYGEGKIYEGSRVRRGPTWESADQDGGYGNVGTVVKVENWLNRVIVQWDGNDSAKFTYRWGAKMEGGKQAYDLVVIEEGSGGVLLFKGAENLLSERDRHCWSAVALALTDSATLLFEASAAESPPFRVMGQRKVSYHQWVHVAVTMSKDCVRLYLNGELDTAGILEDSLLQVGSGNRATVEIETSHPYGPNMDTFWPIEVEGAESYTIIFHENSRTERNYDWVTFWAWEGENAQQIYGSEKYTGGMNSSERNFPGVDGHPPLEIPASRFRVYMHSDGSNQDWGFKLTAIAKVKAQPVGRLEVGSSSVIQDLNPAPLYIGQPPSYITAVKGVEGLFGRFVVFKQTLDASIVKALASADTSDLPKAIFHDDKCLDAISLFDKTLKLLPPTTIKMMITHSVLEAVLRLSFSPLFNARVAATRLCASLLPFAEPKQIDVQVTRLLDGLASSLPTKSSFFNKEKPTLTSSPSSSLPRVHSTPCLSPSSSSLALVGSPPKGGKSGATTPLPGAPKAMPGTPTSSSLSSITARRRTFVREILLRIGEVLTSSLGACSSSIPAAAASAAIEGAENVFALKQQRLALLRALVKADDKHKTWAPIIEGLVIQSLKDVPCVLNRMEDMLKKELETGSLPAKKPPTEQLLATAVIALLGGFIGGLSVGAEVLVELADKKGVYEEGTILALTHAPRPNWATDRENAKKLAATWEDLQGFGDAVVVVLHTEPTKAALYPRNKLFPQALRDQVFLNKIVERGGADVILAAFNSLLQIDLSNPMPKYLPQIIEEDKMEIVESEHPYAHNQDKKIKLDFPGATQVEITFDEQTRTDWNNDYVQILKDEKGLEWYGEEKYHGRDRQQNWPGLQGRPTLIVPASSCIVAWHTDSENNDWGFKLVAKAHTIQVIQPPERPPFLTYAALVQLHMQGLTALTTVIENVPDIVKPASVVVTNQLVKTALKTPELAGEYIRKMEPIELESKHPYECNEERYEVVSFPGAKRLTLIFDPRTCTERGCDFLRIYKDDTRSEYWGENQYTGGKDGSSANWPGLQGTPPLEIPADKCVIYFHSDGSVVDWGWLVEIIPDYGRGAGLGQMTPTEVSMRAYYMSQYLYDGPRAQEVPIGLETFRRAPAIADGTGSVETSDSLGSRSSSHIGSISPVFNLMDVHSSLEEDGPGEAQVGVGESALLTQAKTIIVGKRFKVNFRDAETLLVRAEPRYDAANVGLLGLDQPVTVLEEERDWLRVDEKGVSGWVLRRENDLVYLVPFDETGDDLILLPNDELAGGGGSDGGSGGDGDGASSSVMQNSIYECTDAITTADKPPTSHCIHPIECLNGQTMRLSNAITETAQCGAIAYAKQSVSALIISWPEDEPFSLDTFGGPVQFLRFLHISFEEEKGDIKGSKKLKVLRKKILQVFRGGKKDSQTLAKALMSFSIQQLREASEFHAHVQPTKGLVKTVETSHNYADNSDLYWPISFPGAKRLKLVFDSRCSTEHNCDYVVIYKDGNHSSENRWTPVNYTGRANDNPNKNWPGVAGRPPLYIESDSVEIHFHSDGSNNDWGVKINIYGIFKEPSSAELAEYKEKKVLMKTSLELACWLLEIIATEPVDYVREGLYSKSTLAIIRRYLEVVGADQKIWMVHLVSSMLSNLDAVMLSPTTVAEVKQLVLLLKGLAIAQFKVEEMSHGERKSSLLQALIQATVLGESSSLLSLEQQQQQQQKVSKEEICPSEGVEETKESHLRGGGKGQSTVPVWAAHGLSRGLVLLDDGRTVQTQAGSNNAIQGSPSYVTAILARSPSPMSPRAGSFVWRILLTFTDPNYPPIIGLASALFDVNQALGLNPSSNSYGWDGCRIYAAGHEPIFFGSHFKSEDIVTIELDSNRGTLTYYRNKALVGLAFGPPGSGAAIELSPEESFSIDHRLAVSLPTGALASARLIAPDPFSMFSDEAGNHGGTSCLALAPSSFTNLPSASSSSSSQDSATAFLNKVRDSVEYMKAFVERQIPSVIIRKEFLSVIREKNKIVLESTHPYHSSSSTALSKDIRLPGAYGLEVRFDWNTCLSKAERVTITGGQDQVYSFQGMDHGTDANNIGSSISVGDLVVRGPSWEWGKQDGGAGGRGEVMEIKSWKGKTNAGLLVHWLETEYTALYRWGFEGHFDVIYLGLGERSSRPITILGDTLHLSIQTITSPSASAGGTSLDASLGLSTSAAAANGIAARMTWEGALRFSEPQASVSIPALSKLELNHDFTIDLWVRTQSLVGQRTLVSRAMDGIDLPDNTPMHQFILRLNGDDGQLHLSMINTEMQPGIKISGGQITANKWTHVAFTVQDCIVRLYVDGRQVTSGLYEGGRLISMGAPLVLGNLLSGFCPWNGHMYDVRIWDRAMSAPQIDKFAKTEVAMAMTATSKKEEGCVSRFLWAPFSGDMAPNQMIELCLGAVSGAYWDEGVEPLGKLPSSSPWGYKIAILPIYPTSNLDRIPGVAEDFAAFAEPYMKGDLRHDLAIVRYINKVAQKKGFGEEGLLQCRWEDIAPAEGDMVRLPLIRELIINTTSTTTSLKSAGGGGNVIDGSRTGAAAGSAVGPDHTSNLRVARRTPLQCRYGMVQLLNAYLRDVLSLIDLGTIDKPWSMAALVSKCRGLIYTMLKMPSWTKALEATTGSSNTFDLRLSRSRALKFAASGQVDHEARSMVFSQAFRAIHPMPPRALRRADKLYNVFWMGERSQDAGGPYRETWSVYSSELQSPSLPLLRRTQNGIHSIGQNREQWVLNPGATSNSHLEMFGFLGKLMGVVIRNGELLNLDLSPLIWKLIAHDAITLEDLEGVDTEFVRSLRTLRNVHPQDFEDCFGTLDFTTLSSDERTIELVPGGSQRMVTYESRMDYVKLLERYRLHEFDQQAAAVRAGLGTIVPARLLALFTWEELELMVCGVKQVDVNLLKSVTEYSSCRAEDTHVRFFWTVLENYSDEERSMFLRFCWGRSRLPLRADAFPQRFKLQAFSRSPADQYLPVSHTCFFSLELPFYSSLEIMHQKLTYAIYNCQAIDGDDTGIGMQAAAMGWEE